MKVQVSAFATASEILGPGAVSVTLPEGARLSDLKDLLLERYPALEVIWPRLAIAVDSELVKTDAQLHDGAEIALLPPVSGGAPEEEEVLVDGPIDLASVEATVADPACGAVLLFLGAVRNHHKGRDVEKLTYTAHRDMARKTLQKIVEELRGPKLRTRIVHRLGEVPVGEPSVVIAVASPHRDAAYEASRTALERLKKEVPIWKKEHYTDGEVVWREEEALVAS